MYGFGLTNSNGSVNLGPNSPVWAEGAECVGSACSTAGTGGLMGLVVAIAVVTFFVMLREGGWKRTIKAAIIPVWLISAVVYHLAS